MKILCVVEIEVDDKFKECNEIVGDYEKDEEWEELVNELENVAKNSPKELIGIYEEGEDELLGDEIVVYM